ncbi:MAG: hypothetical protein IID61_06725 [SAR324 cluster bacterium]|nr:hypothetical protein [SAR324 cluster bacterium]
MDKIIEQHNSLEIWFSTGAIVVSIIALILSLVANKRGLKLQARMVEIEEARDLEGRKAKVQASFSRLGPNHKNGPIIRLRVENQGPGQARDVAVMLDREPIRRHRACLQGSGDLEISELGPGVHFDWLLADWYGPRAEIEITWDDDSGDHNQFRSNISI